MGVRADQRHDQEEREGYQEVKSAAGDEAHNSVRAHRGPNFLHQRD
jgi:hypothetical protein